MQWGSCAASSRSTSQPDPSRGCPSPRPHLHKQGRPDSQQRGALPSPAQLMHCRNGGRHTGVLPQFPQTPQTGAHRRRWGGRGGSRAAPANLEAATLPFPSGSAEGADAQLPAAERPEGGRAQSAGTLPTSRGPHSLSVGGLVLCPLQGSGQVTQERQGASLRAPGVF